MNLVLLSVLPLAVLAWTAVSLVDLWSVIPSSNDDFVAA